MSRLHDYKTGKVKEQEKEKRIKSESEKQEIMLKNLLNELRI